MNQLAPAPKILVGVIDHLPREAQAMIIAKYSRDFGTVETWIPKTQEEIDSLAARMGMNYQNYGHKSVGQLGTTTLFLEGVSQLCAKALEDDPLFNGQESSTRYIDYSTQPMVVVKNHPDHDRTIGEYQEKFRALYIRAMPVVNARLSSEFSYESCRDAEKQKKEAIGGQWTEKNESDFKTKWTNTIKARTFDICRGLLPGGSVTNVAFSGTFDLINDHFGAMLYHPSKEMRDIAVRVLEQGHEIYPNGITEVEKLRERFAYIKKDVMGFFYPSMKHLPIFDVLMDVNHKSGKALPYTINKREKWEKVPRDVSENFRFRLGGKIDFGAFRDLHRHRNGVILMPLLTPELGFHPWYLKELPADIATEAVVLLKNLENEIPTIFDMSVHLQYAVPMGARVPVQYDCGLNQLAYLLELRSGKTVHQTLRHWTHEVYQEMGYHNQMAGIASRIYPDLDADNFTLKRGTQTFAEVK